jgi:hypothetical protein
MVPRSTLTRSAPAARQRPPQRSWIEFAVGLAAIAVTVAAGAFLHLRPGANALDRAGFDVVPASTHSSFFHVVTWFGSAPALVLGSSGAAVVAWVARRNDRWRALACLIGPPIAAAVNQFALKPLVGRLYVGELSFVSGSVTVIAGISAAWVLAVPSRIRPAVAVLGCLAVAAMMVAVVALQWHYPTDALVGAWFAIGVVAIIDGATRLVGPRPSGPVRPTPPDGRRPWLEPGVSQGFRARG